MTAYEQVQRLRTTKFGKLLEHGHMAGWVVNVVNGTPQFKAFNLPDVGPADDVVDVHLRHPVTGVSFVVRFRAAKVHGHWGAYKFDAVRCGAPKIFTNGGSIAQVLHYMGANPMGSPR